MRPSQVVFMTVLLTVPIAMAQAPRRSEGVVDERRLVIVTGAGRQGPITVHVGEILQLNPFSLPVTGKTIDAKLSVKIGGDRVLDEIGTLDTSSTEEGRSSKSIFFLVRGKGNSTIDLKLLDTEGREISRRYNRSYVVDSSE